MENHDYTVASPAHDTFVTFPFAACVVILSYVIVVIAAFLLLLLPNLPAGAPRGQLSLFILKNGEEIYGTLVLETRRHVFLKAEGAIRQVKASNVERTVPETQIPAEYRRRRAKLAETAEAHYRLGVWCRTVKLIKEATVLIKTALKLDPKHAGAQKELTALQREDTTRIPWKKDESITLSLQTKVRDGARWRNDTAMWSRLKLWLNGSRPPFTIIPRNEKTLKADYIVRVEVAAKIMKQNRFYGEIPLSSRWQAKARLLILEPKKLKRRFVMKPVGVEETYPPKDPRARSDVCSRAFEKLLGEIRRHPGFRLSNKAPRTRTHTR